MLSSIIQLTICKGAVWEAIVFASFQRSRMNEKRRFEYATRRSAYDEQRRFEYATSRCAAYVFKTREKSPFSKITRYVWTETKYPRFSDYQNPLLTLESFSNDHGKSKENGKNSNRFNLRKNNFSRASRFFVAELRRETS